MIRKPLSQVRKPLTCSLDRNGGGTCTARTPLLLFGVQLCRPYSGLFERSRLPVATPSSRRRSVAVLVQRGRLPFATCVT